MIRRTLICFLISSRPQLPGIWDFSILPPERRWFMGGDQGTIVEQDCESYSIAPPVAEPSRNRASTTGDK